MTISPLVLKRELVQQGFALRGGSKHLKVLKDGRLVSILPRGSGGDVFRSVANNLAQLRRAGFTWPPPPKESPMPTATKTLNPLVHRLAKLVESGRVDLQQVAEVADTTTLVVTGWMGGNSWPNEARTLAITGLLDSLAKPVLPKFNERDHYLSLGLADSREYALLRTARNSLDGSALKAAMLARTNGRISGAATAAHVPWSAVRDLDTRPPTMKTLGRMLTYIGQPITAYVAVGVEAPEWPKGLPTWLPVPLVVPETNGTKDSGTAVPDGGAPDVDKVIAQLPLPSDPQDRVLVPMTEAELATLPPELLAKILHGLLRQ